MRRLMQTIIELRPQWRSEEHTSELQSQSNLVCRLLLEKKKKIDDSIRSTSMSTRNPTRSFQKLQAESTSSTQTTERLLREWHLSCEITDTTSLPPPYR